MDPRSHLLRLLPFREAGEGLTGRNHSENGVIRAG